MPTSFCNNESLKKKKPIISRIEIKFRRQSSTIKKLCYVKK